MYAIEVEGEVKTTTEDFHELLMLFKTLKKETSKPVQMITIGGQDAERDL